LHKKVERNCEDAFRSRVSSEKVLVNGSDYYRSSPAEGLVCGNKANLLVSYDSANNNFEVFRKVKDKNNSYTYSVIGNFKRPGESDVLDRKSGVFVPSYIVLESDAEKIEILYNPKNRVKIVKETKYNAKDLVSSSSYAMLNIQPGEDLTCDLDRTYPSFSKTYSNITIGPDFSIKNISISDDSVTSMAENIMYDMTKSIVNLDEDLNESSEEAYHLGKIQLEYSQYTILTSYKNANNMRFIDWGAKGTPFYNFQKVKEGYGEYIIYTYFMDDDTRIKTQLIENLSFHVVSQQDMKQDENAKNFGLFTISSDGHVSLGLVDLRDASDPGDSIRDEAIYLIDCGPTHYTRTYPRKGKETNIFNFMPSQPLCDNDNFGFLKQRLDERVILLSHKTLQNNNSCVFWFAESVKYINKNFRDIEQVFRAYEIGQAQIEISSQISEKVNIQFKQHPDITTNRPDEEQIGNYDTFFYHALKTVKDEMDMSEFAVELKEVYILKEDKALDLAVRTKGIKEMLFQKQKSNLKYL
jgi:hypothetical protein